MKNKNFFKVEELRKLLEGLEDEQICVFTQSGLKILEAPVPEYKEEEEIPEKWRDWKPRPTYKKVFRSGK